MKQLEALDNKHTYYMVKFLYACTTEEFRRTADLSERKVKQNQQQAEADLQSYVNEVIENLDSLPSEWKVTYEANKEADYLTIAQSLIAHCHPVK